MQSRFNELIIALGGKAQDLRDLFDAATDLPASARDAWIEHNIADADLRSALRELLAADVEKGMLDTPAEQLHARLVAQDLTPEGLLGQQIGGFRLIRTLGHGGMAVVFLGERADRDFAQRAAIKLLRRGLYSELEQRLFQRERRVLASLEHPNIARLIDGGVTEAGIPFLILEYVDGQSITHYADAHRLDVAQRLTLFLAVCNAVEAAHRALIVHRDIKPSNILVTDSGEVKLLDFGIAKLIEDDGDATGTVGVFTRDYAAPEQVRGGAITTATDVYGLGVLLYELLLGKKPEIAADDGIGLRRPSSLAGADPDAAAPAHTAEQLRRLLRGDLDNIVIKALESDPARRYPTAGAFGDDVARHLSGRPVLAHPPTRWYRTRKFIQRHRGGVTITAALVAATFAALGLALWQADVARREALGARTEAAKATQVADFAGQMLSSIDPNRAKGMDRSLMLLVLDAGAKKAQLNLAAQPAVRAAIEEIIGESYYSISEFAPAERHLQAAQEAALGAGLDNATHARLATKRSIALFSLGNRKDDARALDAQALAFAAALPEDDRDRLHAEATALAHECFWRPQTSCADRFARVTALARRALSADDPHMLRILRGQMVADVASGRYAQAGLLYHELAERNRAIYGSEDSRTLQAIRNLINFDDSAHGNDLAEAGRLLRENLPIAERVLGKEHLLTVEMTFDLGDNLAKQNRHAEARPLLEHALASLTTLSGPEAITTITADYALTQTLLALNDLAAAERHARARVATPSAGHGDHGIFATLLATILIAERRYADAERELDGIRAAAGQGPAHADGSMNAIAATYVALYTAWDKPELAKAWREKTHSDAAPVSESRR